MTSTDEPEDGAYVAVKEGNFADLYQRNDDFGPRHSGRGVEARWIPQYGAGDIATWQELTEVGNIAYVGAFVDRSGKEAA